MNISNDVISAAFHPGILDKADRLFRNDDEGIWIELLQNARRAGATGVDVSIEEYASDTGACTVTVQDNGRGIDDFQKLLTLGCSGWAAETQAREDPAGMGFFSLCRCTVEVHSGYGLVRISPAVFLGKAEAMGGPCQRSSQPDSPSGLPASESDGAKRIVILMASVDDSDAADARLELAFVALLDVA
jgi:hypothetical protein